MILDFQVFVDRYPHVFPEIVPAGDYKISFEINDKSKAEVELLAKVILCWNVKRFKGSKSVVPLDFMNMKWRPFQIFDGRYKILDKKVENYTSLLQLPVGARFDWMD